jgi:hypothetical protein
MHDTLFRQGRRSLISGDQERSGVEAQSHRVFSAPMSEISHRVFSAPMSEIGRTAFLERPGSPLRLGPP